MLTVFMKGMFTSTGMLLFTSVSALLAFSQIIPSNLTISGRVQANDTTPIAGLTITATELGNSQSGATITTASDGSFTFTDLPEGTYDLTITDDGLTKPFPFFIPSTPFAVTLEDNSVIDIDIPLIPRVTSNAMIGQVGPFQPSYNSSYDQIAFYGYKQLDDVTATDYDIYYMDEFNMPLSIVDDPSNDFDPDLAPDGSQIVFTSDRDDLYNIYLVGTDESNQIALTFDAGNNFDPQWSPDGQRIAFVSDRSGNMDIYTMDATGQNLTQITTAVTDEVEPRWSPDGQQIAFSARSDGHYNLYVVNADGSNLQQLTEDPADEFDPSWAPGGDAIFFSSNRVNPAHTTTVTDLTVSGRQLTTVNEETSLTNPTVYGNNPAYEMTEYNVWRIALDDSEPIQVTYHAQGSIGARFEPGFIVYNLQTGWDFHSLAPLETAAAKMRGALARIVAAPSAAEWNGIYYNWWTEVPWDWENEHLIAGPTQTIEGKEIQRFANNTCDPFPVTATFNTQWQAGITGNVGYGDFIGIEVTGNVTQSETITLGPYNVQPGQTLIIERGAIIETTTHTGTAWFRTQVLFWNFRKGSGVVTERRRAGTHFDLRTEGTVRSCTPTAPPTAVPSPTPAPTATPEFVLICVSASGAGQPNCFYLPARFRPDLVSP